MSNPHPYQLRLLNKTTDDDIASLAKYLADDRAPRITLEDTGDVQAAFKRLRKNETRADAIRARFDQSLTSKTRSREAAI